MTENCIFCKIISGEIPSYRIYEDDAVYAFLDVYPASEGHTLVAPKKHFSNFTDMKAEDVALLFEAARKVTAAVEKAFSAEGSNIGINNGEVAGQEVPHVHVHVIPRKKGDGGRGIKSIVWTEPDTTNLEEVAEKIRKNL
ncbi:purine nucleoside phosphoramidase [Methanosarcina siciliae C2J]|uniref:Purine nucleoside phosphoramidase n=3 Tax=Methanosarcina siciliae TaxID=38027 RepID=A0A0E3PCR3_9EURY|nr:HIT family protein [Methanosarcina siciliae]AKB27441.1 purine nucleoside phosphoramidase [Methanosarcina siciliae T4/M]AKB31384.1 purine nucleoside phosphoramidase [Methanosarcina siciliae HI350]AKB35340.1 purine nucleoside phosphoramidase [Methanosarcina siciliae C2J]